MRRSKPLAALAGVALFALAACGGSGDDGGHRTGTRTTSSRRRNGFTKNPEAQGPAPEVEGATEGGTLTVYVPGDPGPTTLDPTEGWSVLGNSLQQAWMNRSLTQYLLNPETGADGAGPGPGHRPGHVPTRTSPSGPSRCVTA